MKLKVTESGISVLVSKTEAKQKNNRLFINPKKKACRELALAALCTLDKQWQKPGALKCLDAFGGTGLAGLQWKKALGSKVEVTINEADKEAVANIRTNCLANNFKEGVSSLSHPYKDTLQPQDKPSSDRAVLGDRLDFADRAATECADVVEVSHNDADAILHQQQFNFIYVDAPDSPAPHLASVLRHAFHGAVLVLTAAVPDALYGTAPEVLRRLYAATTSARTHATREMGARILLAAAAQSAARYSKGVHPLYCMGDAHTVTVAVAVKRGAKHANSSAAAISPTLHCLLCHEWEVMQHCANPHENVYKILPCTCYNDNPGKTAVQLGPMWTGPIFDREYLTQMESFAKDLKFSQSTQNLLAVLVEESECPLMRILDIKPQPQTSNSGRKDSENLSQDTTVSSSCETPSNSDQQKQDQRAGSDHVGQSAEPREVGQGSALGESTIGQGNVDQSSGNITEQTTDAGRNELQASTDEGSKKRALDEEGSTSEAKKAKTEGAVRMDVSQSRGYRDCKTTLVPMFYYNLQKTKLKNVDIPKISRVVSLLHREGYRASKTHFDPMAVRTDASLAQLTALLMQHCAQQAH